MSVLNDPTAPVAPPAPDAALRWHRLAQLKVMLLTSGATVTNVALSFVRTKVIAELLGPAGTAVLSQLGNIGGVTGVLATLGIPAAVIQRIAAADGRGDVEGGRRTVATATALLLPLSVLVAIGQLVLSPWLLPLIGRVDRGGLLLGMSAAFIPIAAIATLATSALNGRRLTRATVAAGVAGSAIASLLAVPLVWAGGLVGGAALLGAISAGSAVYALVSLKRGAPDLFAALRQSRLKPDAELAALFRFGIPSVLAGLVGMLMLLSARTIVMTRAGVEQAGLFQAAMAFSHQYAGLFLGSVGVYLMPAMSATTTAEALSEETERSLRLLLEVGTPVILVAMALYDVVLPFAYSKRFVGAGPQLTIQLAADVAKIASWHFAMTLVARGRIVPFLLLEIAGAGTFLITMVLTIGSHPATAGGIAFAAAHVVHLVVGYFVANRLCGLTIGMRGWRAIALASLAAGAGLAAVTSFGKPGRMVVAALACAGLALFVRRLAATGAFKNTPLRRLFKERS